MLLLSLAVLAALAATALSLVLNAPGPALWAYLAALVLYAGSLCEQYINRRYTDTEEQ